LQAIHIIPAILHETFGRTSAAGIASKSPSASGHCTPSAAQLMAALKLKTLGFSATTCAHDVNQPGVCYHGDRWEHLQKLWFSHDFSLWFPMKFEYFSWVPYVFLAETNPTMPRSRSETEKKC
jgi:hypothetical protein